MKFWCVNESLIEKKAKIPKKLEICGLKDISTRIFKWHQLTMKQVLITSHAKAHLVIQFLNAAPKSLYLPWLLIALLWQFFSLWVSAEFELLISELWVECSNNKLQLCALILYSDEFPSIFNEIQQFSTKLQYKILRC